MEIYQLGATFILAMGLMELLKYAIGLLAKRKNGNGKTDNSQDVRIALLEREQEHLKSNHIVHQKAIEDELKMFRGALIKIAIALKIEDPFK